MGTASESASDGHAKFLWNRNTHSDWVACSRGKILRCLALSLTFTLQELQSLLNESDSHWVTAQLLKKTLKKIV